MRGEFRDRGAHRFSVLDGVACDLAIKGGDLRHSWLENEVANRSPSRVVARLSQRSEARERFESKIQSGGMFDVKLKETRLLAENGVVEFSPAQLVDATRLRDLPVQARELIKSTIHEAYIESTQVVTILDCVKVAANEVAAKLRDFRDTWRHYPASTEQEVEGSFVAFQQSAAVLHDMLGELPDGIVVP